jgi:hypothetical protein
MEEPPLSTASVDAQPATPDLTAATGAGAASDSLGPQTNTADSNDADSGPASTGTLAGALPLLPRGSFDWRCARISDWIDAPVAALRSFSFHPLFAMAPHADVQGAPLACSVVDPCGIILDPESRPAMPSSDAASASAGGVLTSLPPQVLDSVADYVAELLQVPLRRTVSTGSSSDVTLIESLVAQRGKKRRRRAVSLSSAPMALSAVAASTAAEAPPAAVVTQASPPSKSGLASPAAPVVAMEAPMQPSTASDEGASDPARLLFLGQRIPEPDLTGHVFLSDSRTHGECLRRMLLGTRYTPHAARLLQGLVMHRSPLFLYNTTEQVRAFSCVQMFIYGQRACALRVLPSLIPFHACAAHLRRLRTRRSGQGSRGGSI